jgi:chaperone modulatory protein CbpM
MTPQTPHASQTLIGVDEHLSAEQLARICGVQIQWVAELAQVGILTVRSDEPMHAWRLGSADLSRARAVQRLQREFEANLDAAALILDLQDEIRRLRALLAPGWPGPVLDAD